MMIERIISVIGVLFMFALVLYGSYICSKKFAKISLQGTQSRHMKLVDRIMLGQDKYLAIVLAGEKYYLIGVASGSINLLTELRPEDLTELESAPRGLSANLNFKELLEKLGKEKDTKL